MIFVLPMLYSAAHAVLLVFAGSVFYDLIHHLMHVCFKSENTLLRAFGNIHMIHHYWYNRRLKYNSRYEIANQYVNYFVEWICQCSGAFLFHKLIVEFNLIPFLMNNGDFVLKLVLAFLTIRTAFPIYLKGLDSNHIAFSWVPADKWQVFVGPEYHAMHHIYPEKYYSSLIRIYDWIWGTAYNWKDKKVTLTGASGSFGSALLKILQDEEGVKQVNVLKHGLDFDSNGKLSDRCHEVLKNETDILILAHGSKDPQLVMAANCTTFVALIGQFMTYKEMEKPLVTPEVWAVGSEIEIHPAWGDPVLQAYSRSKRAFMKHARAYWDSKVINYRHIVPSAFTSPMGPGLISGDTAVRIALWFIKRSARFVPVTYTTLAFFHYFKFIFLVNPNDKMK